VLKSGLLGILGQRLVRKLCVCRRESCEPADRLGMAVDRVHVATGCSECSQSGYRGRIPLVESFSPRKEAGARILRRADVQEIEQAAIDEGMIPLRARAITAVQEGLTSPQEVMRVMGGAEL
jgi:type II secretory ATPase GspE/PulE/Tfp pilus assembly ATPase PilB-like protein